MLSETQFDVLNGMPQVVREVREDLTTRKITISAAFARLSAWCLQAPDEFRQWLAPPKPEPTDDADQDRHAQRRWREEVAYVNRSNRSRLLDIWKHMSYWLTVGDRVTWERWRDVVTSHYGHAGHETIARWDDAHRRKTCARSSDIVLPWYCAKCAGVLLASNERDETIS